MMLMALFSCGAGASGQSAEAAGSPEAEIMRYVSAIDYGATDSLQDEAVMTERMVQIVKLMQVSDSASIRKGLGIFLNGIKHDDMALSMVDRLAELYLYNPASPVRDEKQYIAYLESLLAVDSLPELMRETGEEYLRLALLNRQGSVANDFRYIDRNGKQQSLHGTEAEKLLLVFYDPECTHCNDILDMLANDERINGAVEAGGLKVLAIYAEGKRDVWEKDKDSMPANWQVGYDLTGILDSELYDLPAMPTLYLLDSDKRVILKDPVIKINDQ